MTALTDLLAVQLKRHEGYSSKPYRDTVGKTTIGYGRNLDDVGIAKDEADHMLLNDILRSISDARGLIRNFNELSLNRQAVLANMAFNLGANRLSLFSRFRKCVLAEDWKGAAKEMLNSRWAQQVGNRAIELATLMENG